MAIEQINPETGEVEIRAIQTNPRIEPPKSHHKAKSQLPGGEKYTAFTKWRRRILGIFGIAVLVWFCYSLAVNMNVGGLVQPPSGPSEAQAQNAFKKATAPGYDTMKYLSDTTSGTPTVENVEVGRVVTNTGEVSVGYSCEATADVKFSNASLNSTSKMRVKFSYNSLLHTWEAGEFSTERSNYRPNSGPDLNKIQNDAFNLLNSYDSDAATKMKNATITRDGSIPKEGGTVTITFTKEGAGTTTNNYYGWTTTTDLVKTMDVRVEWSEISGWVASVTWLKTEGEGLEDDSSTDTDTSSTTKETATEELSCSSGSYVRLSGDVSGTTLTTSDTTKYTIDGEEVTTKEVTLTGNTSIITGQSSVTVAGYISIENGKVTLNVQN